MLTQLFPLAVSKDAILAAVQARPHAFILESGLAVGGQGQFSILGFDPFLVFRVAGNSTTVTWRDGRVDTLAGEPLAELRALHSRFAVPRDPQAVVPMGGGAVGFFSYEFGLRFENVARLKSDDLAVPEVELGFYDGVIVCDERTGQIVLASDRPDLAEAARVLARIEADVRAALAATAVFSAQEKTPAPACDVQANFTREGYCRAVGQVRDYIAAGDVYQINLSQRFETPLPCAPIELYRRVRDKSPAPYGCYFNFDTVQVAGVSPERFLQVRGRDVATRPIKGTRPRGTTPEVDGRLRDQLATSEKDRAELLMIVDLERNDLGRVCEPGSIQVSSLYAIEAHPTVWHQVADVTGRLAAGRDVFDCLRAAFPGGSITGAPKVRAMQIIDELEPHRRHLYTGAMGYLGFDGDAELNIAIRTITCVGGRAYFHAGGGIVWDSDPDSEYEETLAKARALRAAVENESG